MLLVSLSNITKKFDDQLIVENGSLAVNEGDKIGLVGRNGAGKTTLFHIITGKIKPDAGSVDYARGVKIGSIAQELDDFLELSLYDFCLRAHPRLNDLRIQIKQLEPQIQSDNPSAEIVAEYHHLGEQYEERGEY